LNARAKSQVELSDGRLLAKEEIALLKSNSVKSGLKKMWNLQLVK
jgi:hypothetical protein